MPRFRSSSDRDDAHEFAEPLHHFGLDALERGAAQFAENAGACELDHDLVAIDLDQLAIASVALQVRANFLDHRLDDPGPLVVLRRQLLRDFRFNQHGQDSFHNGLYRSITTATRDSAQANDLPQPQLAFALGFSKVKPDPSSATTKSIVVPTKYSWLFMSTNTRTPSRSITVSSGSMASTRPRLYL